MDVTGIHDLAYAAGIAVAAFVAGLWAIARGNHDGVEKSKARLHAPEVERSTFADLGSALLTRETLNAATSSLAALSRLADDILQVLHEMQADLRQAAERRDRDALERRVREDNQEGVKFLLGEIERLRREMARNAER